ncbi:hypothetical protein DES53_10243 [Roseimicrobium gellanilyticum]|uniref:Uncharacterized protein n=1 Tax=Roseimicrobium gellanilyticum TaxID=748857 RepID=A0A366HPU2_9BACT|nr:hypothetical protein [Roseimicrobium gellanilyticum]RBP45661.1 hypothetical protein DES53_10243 [Roseimicrobium gellanilyticum]
MTPLGLAKRSENPGRVFVVIRSYLLEATAGQGTVILQLLSDHFDKTFGKTGRIPTPLFLNDLHYFFCGTGRMKANATAQRNALLVPYQAPADSKELRLRECDKNVETITQHMREDIREIAEECLADMVHENLREQTQSFFRSCLAEFFKEGPVQLLQHTLIREIKDSVSSDFRTLLAETAKDERIRIQEALTQQTVQSLREDLQAGISAMFKGAMPTDLRETVRVEFRDWLMRALQEERDTIREHYMEEVRQELREEIREEVRNEVKQELIQRLLANPDSIKQLLAPS